MPLGSTQLEVRLSALMTRLIGASNLEARTELGSDGNFRFTDGTGALQAAAVVDTSVLCNNVAAAFSGFTRIDGNAFGSLTKLKGVVLFNPATNASTVISSSFGLAGTIPPGGMITWASPDAAGLSVSGVSTVTSNGGGSGQSVRVILLLA